MAMSLKPHETGATLMKTCTFLRHRFASQWFNALSGSMSRRRQQARTNVVAGETLESRQLLSASSRVGDLANRNGNYGGIPRQPPTGGAPSPVDPVAPTYGGITRDPGLNPGAWSPVAGNPGVSTPDVPPDEGIPRDPSVDPFAPSPVDPYYWITPTPTPAPPTFAPPVDPGWWIDPPVFVTPAPVVRADIVAVSVDAPSQLVDRKSVV